MLSSQVTFNAASGFGGLSNYESALADAGRSNGLEGK
jgi:hypothetical protein